MSLKRHVLIVAGGHGTRMETNIPKQFLLVKEKPILMYTISVFYEPDISIFVVLPEEYHSYWNNLVSQFRFDIPHRLVSGGSSRFQSVKNGLSAIHTEGLLAIHDGVRPFVAKTVINQAYVFAEKYGNAVPSIDLKESLREIKNESSLARDRTLYKSIQTPQTFHITLLKEAYKQAEEPCFTDDASVFEKMGHKIVLINGNVENIKITTPIDLLFAEAIINNFTFS